MVAEDSKHNKSDKFITIALIVANFLIYTLLGIVIFVFFVISNVKADTWVGNPNYILVHNGSTQIYQCTLTSGGSQAWCPQNRIVGNLGTRATFEWDGLTLLKDHTYQFEIRGGFLSASQISNFSSNIIPYIYVHNGSSWVQATCDRNCEVTYTDLGTYTYYFGTTNNYTTLSGYAYRVNWKGEIDISNTNMIALRYVLSSGAIIAPVNAIPYLSIIDTQNDTADIINNANKNTQDIIDNQNANTQELLDALDIINNAHLDTNDFLTDNSVSNYGGVFNNIHFNSTGAVSGIISAPLSAITNLLSHTCNDLVLPLPFVNENLTLPCMDTIYTTHFGAFYTLYQTIILGITAYWVCLNFFKLVKGFSEPMEDRIEVLDL